MLRHGAYRYDFLIDYHSRIQDCENDIIIVYECKIFFTFLPEFYTLLYRRDDLNYSLKHGDFRKKYVRNDCGKDNFMVFFPCCEY